MSLRVEYGVTRGPELTILVDGQPVPAFAGETVATALLASGIRWLRSSPTIGAPRGLFCAMGVCQECVISVEGRAVPACTTPVREGLRVSTGRRSDPRSEFLQP